MLILLALPSAAAATLTVGGVAPACGTVTV